MKRIYAVSLFLIIIACRAGIVHAKAYTSNELISGANSLDGSNVTYKGEIVAVIMNRGEHSWINLNDGYNAIGIWCDRASLKDVKTLGNYKHEGDVLEIAGTFHRACPEHGGELDIHSDNVRIELKGFHVKENISFRRINIAIAFFMMTLIALFALRNRI